MKQGSMKISDKQIIESYNSDLTLHQTSAKYGITNVTLWRRANKLGLKWSDKQKKNYNQIELQEIIGGKQPQYQTLKLKKRLLKAGLKRNKCEECGIEEHNNKPINMQLDHIDGDSHNHLWDNLRMLCPNCHSQTDTFSGRNKN